MNRSFVALSLVGLLGMGLLLAGCGDSGSGSGSTSGSDAARQQQFLNGRGGTPGPGTPVVAGQGGRPGVFGTIDKIDGNQITVKSQADGTETVVQAADGATIGKQADAQSSDVVVGVNVVAMGTMNGSTLEAQNVQISNGNLGLFGGGGGFGGGGRGGFNGTPGPGNGNGNGQGGGRFFRGGNGTPGPNASGTPGPGGPGRNFAAGKVASVDGNTITLNMPNGSTGTFTTSDSTRFQKEVTIQLSDLKVGDNIVAGGQQSGNVFQANTIQVVTNFGGFGAGGRGRQAQGTPTP
jgi:hypothetical protein